MGEGYKGMGEIDSARTTDDGAMERMVDRMTGDYSKCRIAGFDVPYQKAGRVYRASVKRQQETGTKAEWNSVYVAIENLRRSKKGNRVNG